MIFNLSVGSNIYVVGGDDETRTHYLYNANVALSQMSYAPKCL